jgi:hypothetical protein
VPWQQVNRCRKCGPIHQIYGSGGPEWSSESRGLIHVKEARWPGSLVLTLSRPSFGLTALLWAQTALRSPINLLEAQTALPRTLFDLPRVLTALL